MRANRSDRISRNTRKNKKRSRFIILLLSTLLAAALAAIGILRTESVQYKETLKNLLQIKQKNQQSNLVDVDEFIKHQQSEKTNQKQIERARQQERINRLSQEQNQQSKGFPRAITIDDLPPSKNPISIYTPPKTQRAETEVRNTSRQRATTQTVRWNWNLRAGKISEDNKGVFYYTLTNNTIDATTVCNNYSYGTIRYRNCRKAAKQWFKDNCSQNFTAACGASSMRP